MNKCPAVPVDPMELIDRRIDGLKAWLMENAPYCAVDQSHLDENSVERAYWHFGYLMALKDARKLLSSPKTS